MFCTMSRDRLLIVSRVDKYLWCFESQNEGNASLMRDQEAARKLSHVPSIRSRWASQLLETCKKTGPLPSGSLPTSRRWAAGRWPETASPSETRNVSSWFWFCWRWMQQGCWLQRPCLASRLGWMKSLSMAMSWHELFGISSAPPDLDMQFVPFVI